MTLFLLSQGMVQVSLMQIKLPQLDHSMDTTMDEQVDVDETGASIGLERELVSSIETAIISSGELAAKLITNAPTPSNALAALERELILSSSGPNLVPPMILALQSSDVVVDKAIDDLEINLSLLPLVKKT